MLKVKSDRYSTPNYIDFEFYRSHIKRGKFTISHRDNLWIWNVEILIKFRGMGYGRKLMKEAMDFCREKYPEEKFLHLYVLTSNTVARNLYESLGFKYCKIQPDPSYRMDMYVDLRKIN